MVYIHKARYGQAAEKPIDVLFANAGIIGLTPLGSDFFFPDLALGQSSSHHDY
jgi:hypothetical protein